VAVAVEQSLPAAVFPPPLDLKMYQVNTFVSSLHSSGLLRRRGGATCLQIGVV
jgi:hypothetical protein